MEAAGRRGEQGEQQEAAAEETEADPATLAIVVAELDGVVGVVGETPGLGQPAPRPDDHDDAERREQIDRPPAPFGRVGEREHPHRHAGTEAGTHREHGGGPRPGAGRHLLDRHDGHEDPERGREAPGEELAAAEHVEVGRQAAEEREDAAGDAREQQQGATAAAVGEHRHDERDENAEAHDAEHHTLGGVAPAELVDRERQCLGENGAEVAVDDLHRAQQTEHRGGMGGQPVGRRPPVAERLLPGLDRPANRPGEQPAPHRNRQAIGGRLHDIVVAVGAFGGGERATVRTERAVLEPPLVGADLGLGDDVGAGSTAVGEVGLGQHPLLADFRHGE